ncbi:unnamed protein product [Prorocentrum cordatum]|uniref:Chlorophyll a-b binding protein, chloroplastic n=1 Tax=Prorocentrum cordatum TaxID=2364126 RepID=A0ABN9RYC5_9DINO|nr:unnamed protein product [Polarella glacialis]
MMAIIGVFLQDGLTGSAWGDWATYTDSPLRAFESEWDLQAPVGYWDPLGLAKDVGADVLYRRRCTEVKHGRVAMWAAIGFIVQDVFLWPGGVVLEGPAFASLPNGLSAPVKVSGADWGQVFLFYGSLELHAARQVPTDPPDKLSRTEAGFGKSYFGALGGCKGDGIEDPEKNKRSLSAELAEGRLAMTTIIGMLFQDNLTGSAWGDWATYTDSPLRALESEVCVQAPVGYWDPLGLAEVHVHDHVDDDHDHDGYEDDHDLDRGDDHDHVHDDDDHDLHGRRRLDDDDDDHHDHEHDHDVDHDDDHQTTDDHPGDTATHNDTSEHSRSSSGSVPPPVASTDEDVPEGNREAVEVTIPPPASWSNDGVPVGNREEVACSDQGTAHTNDPPPLQLYQQPTGKERDVTAEAADAAEAAEYPPQDSQSEGLPDERRAEPIEGGNTVPPPSTQANRSPPAAWKRKLPEPPTPRGLVG